MNRLALLIAAIVTLMSLAVMTAPSYAQATRTWVSGVGDDANPCSRTAPCKTFAGAISKTATGGEINCLDSAGFGVVTITKSISIVCEGVIGGIAASGSNGIIVNGTNIEVYLQGLDIDGFNTGLNGIRILAATNVIIREVSIRNFTQRGVDMQATANSRVFIQDSQIISNTLGGVNVAGAGGVVNGAFVERTMIDLNGSAAFSIAGPSSAVLTGNTFAGSPAALAITNSGIVVSYGNNVFRGTGLPTQTLPLQ